MSADLVAEGPSLLDLTNRAASIAEQLREASGA